MQFPFFSKPEDQKAENLIQACMSGNIERVKELIDEGTNVNAVNLEYGDTALSQAAFKGYEEIVDILLNLSPTGIPEK